jgi:triosephosphate isomerase
MLQDIVHYAIIGHSERRIYFDESLEDIREKVAAAVRNGISPILCVGESRHERKNGETRQVLHDQITSALANLTSAEMKKVVIAYEPVWAISTFDGEIAKPDDAKKAIDFIRHQVAELYGKKASERLRVLYGGSVDDHIVGGYLAIEGCDGVLVGGASMNYHKFSGIVDSAYRLRYQDGEM